MKSILFLSLAVLLVACGKRHAVNPSSHKEYVIFVNGNPMKVVDGNITNKKSFITTDNFHQFNQFYYSKVLSFEEKQLVEIKKQRDIETENAAQATDATESNEGPDDYVYSFKQESPTEYTYNDILGQNTFYFETSSDSNELKLVKYKVGDFIYPVKMIHYSVTPDMSKMNFLFSIQTSTLGTILKSATLHRLGQSNPTDKVDAKYAFLYGPGVIVPWRTSAEKNITVDVCPSMAKAFSKEEIETAIKVWEKDKESSQNIINLKVNFKESCYPFSDLNEHSLNYVSNYFVEADKDVSTNGFAFISEDLNDKSIYDADIFLFDLELRKFESNKPLRTLTHEMGHFLGLDHKFDGTPSIMSYSAHRKISPYDYEALEALYHR